MKNIYTDGQYYETHPEWHTGDSAWKANKILNILQKNKLNPKSICEVGCGAGEILNQLHRQMPSEVTFDGYDISPQAIELCESRRKERLSYHNGNFLEMDTPSYDLVMAIDVFEHVEDYFGFLRTLRTKGDFKLFHIPLDLSVQALLRNQPILLVRQTVGHIHYFTKDTALATLQDTGYTIQDYFYTAGSFDLPAHSFKTKLARFPRKLLFQIHPDFAARVLGGFSLMVLAR